MAFIDGGPRSARVRALTDAQLLRLSFEAFEVLAAKDGALGRSILLDLARVLAYRLRRTETLFFAGAT